MVNTGAFNLEQLQEEIEPILNEILNNHPTFKEVLQRYDVLEATRIELKLDINKDETPASDIRNSEEQNFNFNVTQSRSKEMLVATTVWCPSLGCYVQPGKCP